MENKELKFKTNLNCGGCVSKVQSDLDNAAGVCHWDVDTDNSDKILTVSSKGISEDEVIKITREQNETLRVLEEKESLNYDINEQILKLVRQIGHWLLR